MQELGLTMDEAKDLAVKVFTKRINRVSELEAEIDTILGGLSENGHAELADMVRQPSPPARPERDYRREKQRVSS